ncbi:hypothetical protein CUC53_17075 [Aeromonas cavernicola]|uniref:Uncharacterized protein n=1 Tax=Aeromonas cavernicola TaxID=1006623 RepID=A0A2H9U0X4_9GAMM|nr:hypothetical protein CUC53_17075 [Aeromonas cavernicola]
MGWDKVGVCLEFNPQATCHDMISHGAACPAGGLVLFGQACWAAHQWQDNKKNPKLYPLFIWVKFGVEC